MSDPRFVRTLASSSDGPFTHSPSSFHLTTSAYPSLSPCHYYYPPDFFLAISSIQYTAPSIPCLSTEKRPLRLPHSRASLDSPPTEHSRLPSSPLVCCFCFFSCASFFFRCSMRQRTLSEPYQPSRSLSISYGQLFRLSSDDSSRFCSLPFSPRLHTLSMLIYILSLLVTR